MPPSPPCLRLLHPYLLLLLVGLAGCGPASSDSEPRVESRTSANQTTLPKQGPAPAINPLIPVPPGAPPQPLASANGTNARNNLIVPARTAKELASPTVAVETWAPSPSLGVVDPLIQALNDKDGRHVGPEALIEEQEYQDVDEEQASQDLNEGQANQDPDEKGEK